MKDKVLITIYVPNLSKEYNLFIPFNERIGVLVDNIVKSIYELSENRLNLNKKYYLFNEKDASIYDKNMIVSETDIKNTSKLILFGF